MPASVLRVLPEAALDLFRAEAWYRERSVRAADGFLVEVGRGFALIREAPDRWAIFRKGARRFVLERYPFSILYRVEGSTIWVIAVAHAKRRPEYWRARRPQ